MQMMPGSEREGGGGKRRTKRERKGGREKREIERRRGRYGMDEGRE